MNLLFIGCFGLLGVLSRFGVDRFFEINNQSFPKSTLLINIAGSFLAGLFFALGERQIINSNLQMGLIIGFCGGFTTFSAYTLQSFGMLNEGKYLLSLSYLFGSPILGLVSAALPILLLRKLFL